MFIPEIKFAEKDGFSIAYQVWGEGAETLIYVPGMVSHLDVSAESPEYVAFLSRLSENYKVIIFDKRGQGLSDRDSTVPGIESRMDDIDAVADAEKVDGFYLFGYSEGAPIALLYAATHPEKTLGVSVFGGFAKFLNSDDFKLMADKETILEGFLPNWGKGLSGYMFCPQAMPGAQTAMSKLERMVCSPRTLRTILETNFQIDIRKSLSSVEVPCLIAHSRDDRAISVKNGRYLADHINGAKYIEYAQGGHFPHLGNIEQIVSDLVTFFSNNKQNYAAQLKSLTTVLFTDIVASTSKMLELGDKKWATKIKCHDDLVSVTVKEYSGNVIKSTGDGSLCVFDGPVRATRCAMALRARLKELDLQIRCGLNFGQVEWVANDVVGKTVNISSRVMDLAEAGQIFLTKDTVDVLTGADLSTSFVGKYQLKGFEIEWDVYQIC